jgi:hypothetical protein
VIFLAQATGWGYADLMAMDAEELSWWIERAMDFEKAKHREN